MGYERQFSFSAYQANTPDKPLPGSRVDIELDAIATTLAEGLTAYDQARANGFQGSVIAWLASLKGDQGAKGDRGDIGLTGGKGEQGLQGLAGSAGAKGDRGFDGSQGPQGLQGGAGSKGDTGAQGLQGPRGLQGLQGDTGAAGAQGDAGSQGLPGAKGDTGAAGLPGTKGDQGVQGIKGDQGEQGPQGLPGAKGDTGAKGDQGIQGLKGDQGTQGPAGAAGVKGDTGAQGLQGVKGDQGAGVTIKGSVASPAQLPAGASPGDTYIVTGSGTGYSSGDGYVYGSGGYTNVGQIRGPQGPAGLDGAAGAKGDTGAQGLQGSKGDTGAQGLPGAKGDTGTAGADGAAGAAGAKGDTGAQGIQGVKGDAGATGAKGDTGAQGIQGIQGTAGTAGAKGDTGAQGIQGTQGVQGNTGATGPAAWLLPVAYAAGIVATPVSPATTTVYSGQTYVCKVGHTTAASFAAANWQLVAQQGVQGTQGIAGSTGPASWALPVNYASGLAAVTAAPSTTVVYQGSTYVCKTAHTTTATFDGTKWTLINQGMAATSVQQGTGPGQTTNTVSIGFSAAALLKASVDSADQGAILTDYTLGGGSIAAGATRRAALAKNPVGSHFVDISGTNCGPTGNAGFVRIGIGTKDSDAEGLWDATNFWYNVPETGLYMLDAAVRPGDSVGAFEFGYGLDSAEQDGNYFKWDYRPGVTRWVGYYSRAGRLTAGQQIRLVLYGYYPATFARCSCRIYMVKAD